MFPWLAWFFAESLNFSRRKHTWMIKEFDFPSAIEYQWAWENLHSLETPRKSPLCSAGNSFKNSNLLASSLPWIYEHIGVPKNNAYPRLLHGSSGQGWILPWKFGGSLKFKDGQVHLDLGKHLDVVNLPHQTLAKRYVPSSCRDTIFGSKKLTEHVGKSQIPWNYSLVLKPAWQKTPARNSLMLFTASHLWPEGNHHFPI